MSQKKKKLSGTVVLIFAAAAAFCIFAFFFILLMEPVSRSDSGVSDDTPVSSESLDTQSGITQDNQSDSDESEAAFPPDVITIDPHDPYISDESAAKTDDGGIPQAVNGAALCIIFDDGGQRLEQVLPFIQLPFPVTVAVLPGLPDSAAVAQAVRESGNEVLLHQPMQAQNLAVNPGPGAIMPEMQVAEAAETVRRNLAEIWPVAGINNHEGSLITEILPLCGAVLDVCGQKEIFFLDSRTTASSVVRQAAAERNMKVLERDVFLDNTQAKEDILKEFMRGLSVANRSGYAIMIGHVWSSGLPDMLNELYPALNAAGYRFVKPSELYIDVNIK